MRRLQLALFATLMVMGSGLALAATPATITGLVSDSAGVPQIGAVVELLRPDMTVIATVYTTSKGQFSFASVLPGKYALKAMGTSFLPSLRENVHVRSSSVVNLTLNTLYEVMQWLPAEPRDSSSKQDDWKWTLRSAANRPLLRWLEDGPLVVVSEKAGAHPRLKARLMATGQTGTFGENGERITAETETTPSNSRELLARVDFAPGSDAGMESMLGFRQELGYAGSVQSVAAVAIHPEIEGAGSAGLQEAAFRTSETIRLGDEFEAEAGAEQVMARFGQKSPNTVIAALPYFSAAWHGDEATVRYRMTTIVPTMQSYREDKASAFLPALSVRGGNLVLERGLHQEIGWERKTDDSGVSVMFFADRLDNPVLEAMTHMASGGDSRIASSALGDSQIASGALIDRTSGILRSAGPGFYSTGFMASAEHRLPGDNRVRLSFANGNALVMPASERAIPFNAVLASAHPRRAAMYSISLSGTLEGTGTQWHASYRWQPDETVTPVAAFASDAADPFLNLQLRQPVNSHREGSRSLDVMIDVHNLLAQGFRPYVLTDGSILMFAQDQRSFSGGLAFTF
jgi:Carboxypeptidase regulatory-like domain